MSFDQVAAVSSSAFLRLAAAKKTSVIPGRPVANMWWTQTPKPMNSRMKPSSANTSDNTNAAVTASDAHIRYLSQFAQDGGIDARVVVMDEPTAALDPDTAHLIAGTITALAERFHMTLTGMKKHVGVLEQAGLVVTEKIGRVRTCRIGDRRLEDVAAWVEQYQQLWDARFGELDQIIDELKRKEQSDGHRQPG